MARRHAHSTDAATLDAAIERHTLEPSVARAATKHLFGAPPDGHTVDGQALVAAQQITVIPAAWSTFGPRGTELVTDTIRRSDLYEAASAARQSGSWLPVMIATYAWGQGTNGYGPTRLNRILEPVVDVDEHLSLVVATLDEHGPAAAYQSLLTGPLRLRNWGPAFFTKFLHVADPTRALILDKVVATALRPFVVQAAEQAGAVLDRPVDRAAAWLFSGYGWSPHRYQTYLDWASRMLGQLNETSRQWGSAPAIVEYALFTHALTAHPHQVDS